jgi:ACS family hexuronate transporter-like MFS transporter
MMERVARTIGRYRWVICLLLFINTANNYMDRQMLGILVPDLERRFHWPKEIAWARIVIAFQIAYALGLPFFGRLVDKFGTRATYAWATIFWGLAAYGHALCREWWQFAIMRFFLGLGEAVNFPAAIKAITEWFPRKERALATGLFNSGANIGAVITPALIPWLAVHYGWQWAFVLGGSINFIFVAFWWPIYRRPQEKAGLDPAELEYILSDTTAEEETARIPWRNLIGYRAAWAFILGKFLTDPIWWFYLFWLPKWLSKDHALNLQQLGWPLVVVYTLVTVGSVGGGYISSALIHRGVSVNVARKTAFLVCALSVTPVALVTRIQNVWWAVLIIGLAAAAHAGWSANLFTLVSDCFPKHAVASVTGMGGMAGSLGAIIFSEFIGRWLQKTEQYWLLFGIGATAYLIALAVIHALVPRIRQVEISVDSADRV